jgi:lipopolysaccharide transport system permease protein
MLWIPVLVIPVLLLALGIGWFCSALGVFFRDINQLTAFLSMALMFASAVFYPASKIPPAAWTILRFNPLIHAIELSRNAALWGSDMNYHHLFYLYAISVAAAAVGFAVFQKLRPAFADVL